MAKQKHKKTKTPKPELQPYDYEVIVMNAKLAFDTMSNDLKMCLRLGPKCDNDFLSAENQFWIRNSCRIIFSYIEAGCHLMRMKLLEGHRVGQIELPYEKKLLLQGSLPSLDDRAQLVMREAWPKTTQLIRFTVETYSDFLGGRRHGNIEGAEWQNFKLSLKVRDRITHPKGNKELEVTMDTFVMVMQSLAWFQRTYSGLLQGGIAELKA